MSFENAVKLVPAFAGAVALFVTSADDYAKAKADGVVTLEEILASVQEQAPKVLEVVGSAKDIPEELAANPLAAAEVASYAAVDIVVDLFSLTDTGIELKSTTEIFAAIEAVGAGIIKALPGGITTIEVIQLAIGNVSKIVAAINLLGKVPAEAKEDFAGALKLIIAEAFKLQALSKPALA